MIEVFIIEEDPEYRRTLYEAIVEGTAIIVTNILIILLLYPS
ncbi:MAG: hypothetical protein ACE5KE_09860 [Methanosarcinales archaeon]